jgi:23S rRNA (adenine-N6)-dimethyltransferase
MDPRREWIRHGASPPLGQHFLSGRLLASALVRAAAVAPFDLVVEIGAGTGALTEALASRARLVLAVEIDPNLASRLRRRFAGTDNVRVIERDALAFDWPAEPFRAFGNVPFAITTRLLRSILDTPWLRRADLVVQWEVALKRAFPKSGNLLGFSWGPWWTFSVNARLSPWCFHPRPAVHAALLTIQRRVPPLLEPSAREAFTGLLIRAFRRPGSWPRRGNASLVLVSRIAGPCLC